MLEEGARPGVAGTEPRRVTLEDMGIPAQLAGGDPRGPYDVRASRIRIAGPALRAELWMGGGYTVVGEPVSSADVAAAWVIDCAGDLPGELATGAALYIPRVFEDIEQTPAGYGRIRALARRVASAVDASAPPPAGDVAAPARVYVMCKQGLNRSGLVLGCVLRELGLSGDQVVAALRAQRPGAVANLAFERLLHE